MATHIAADAVYVPATHLMKFIAALEKADAFPVYSIQSRMQSHLVLTTESLCSKMNIGHFSAYASSEVCVGSFGSEKFPSGVSPDASLCLHFMVERVASNLVVKCLFPFSLAGESARESRYCRSFHFHPLSFDCVLCS
uniref:Uncharacterized protein n=1 Tax=Salix viminalis TaxID=40686 RepID=A0A6N2N5E4_SALVM